MELNRYGRPAVGQYATLTARRWIQALQLESIRQAQPQPTAAIWVFIQSEIFAVCKIWLSLSDNKKNEDLYHCLDSRSYNLTCLKERDKRVLVTEPVLVIDMFTLFQFTIDLSKISIKRIYTMLQIIRNKVIALYVKVTSLFISPSSNLKQ